MSQERLNAIAVCHMYQPNNSEQLETTSSLIRSTICYEKKIFFGMAQLRISVGGCDNYCRVGLNKFGTCHDPFES